MIKNLMCDGNIYIYGIVFLAAALTGGFFVFDANATECSIEATLSAEGAGSQEFLFSVTAGKESHTFTLMDGQSDGGSIPEGGIVTVTEAPPAGWLFGGIGCDAGPGIVITQNGQGFTIECVNASEGEAVCTIVNVLESRPVPTLSEWGMITAAAGLGLIGMFFVIRRKGATA